MFYNLHQHREATCRRQKEAWEETILMRLKKEKQNEKGTPSNQVKKIKIPIVIWGLEASPSFFDFNNEASEPLQNRIRTLDLLHENYLYNKSAKDGNNYGVRIIKNWINEKYAPKTKEGREYSYKSLITELSGTISPNRHFSLYQVKGPQVEETEMEYYAAADVEETIQPQNPIHLVYDIFPEWHGLPVSQKARNFCYSESYMCSKINDFEQHVKRIQFLFSQCNGIVETGGIHFVWLGTKQKHKDFSEQQACHQFFCCLNKKLPNIMFWYNQNGFVTGEGNNLQNWPIDLPEFQKIGVSADWSMHIVYAGYDTVEALRKQKPLNLLKELNSFKNENNLNIPDLELNQVESWFND